MKEIATFLFVVAALTVATSQGYGGRHALFVRTSSGDAHSRVQRDAPVSAADVMAQNILEWIQGIYRQGARKPRQQSDPPGYLPPYTTQRPPERPRPFQAPSVGSQVTYTSPSQNEVTDYPYQRQSTGFSPPKVALPSGRSTTVQPPPFSAQRPTYLPPNNRSPYVPSSYNPSPTAAAAAAAAAATTLSFSNGLSNGPSSFPPSPTTQTPQPGYAASGGISTNYGYSSSSFGSVTPGKFSTPTGFSTTYGYSTQKPSPTYIPSVKGSSTGGYPSVTGFTSTGKYAPYPNPTAATETTAPEYPSSSGYPSSTPGKAFPPPNTDDSASGTSGIETAKPFGTSTGTALPTGEGSSASGTVSVEGATEDDNVKHPPHIHALDVECSKTMMTINIEFNRVFDGVIYSKGFFANPECRYVEENSGQTKYSFTVNLDSCGTQFINDFAGEAGQAYLENVLVLQNEPGIQEVWDTVRRVRCLWEGNISKALTVNFSVDMLNQEIVTFSGDTAVAKLDIQVGRGPFAPAADGLVKIGETMTLVVSVEGDPGFDLQVRDCLARDESSSNTIQLTDERGCILKPKLFGAFQKTKDTGNTGASIIAYAYFQAFKFPDVMDLFVECNVELCKTDCEPCPETNQQIEPGRRRRSIAYASTSNATSNGSTVLLSDPVRVARGFRVIMVDDLSKASNQVLEQLEETAVEEVARTTMNVCITYSGFYTAISFLLTTVLVTTISAVALYVKLQRVYRSKAIYS